MTDKKTTNLVLKSWTPQAADRTTALDEFGEMSEECAKAASTLIEGASNEPTPADPGLLEGLQSALNDAKQALDDADLGLREAEDAVEQAMMEIESAMSNVEELMKDQND